MDSRSKPYRVDYEQKLRGLLKADRRFEWLDAVRSYEK
jgi:hypothetical protein